jgi:hypothetical protein
MGMIRNALGTMDTLTVDPIYQAVSDTKGYGRCL